MWKCSLTSKSMQQRAQMDLRGRTPLSVFEKEKEKHDTDFMLLHLCCSSLTPSCAFFICWIKNWLDD